MKLNVPKEIAITPTGKVGMTHTHEINEILDVLRQAKARGELPELVYEHSTHPKMFGADPLYLQVKDTPLARTAVKVREVLRKAFGNKYEVHLV